MSFILTVATEPVRSFGDLAVTDDHDFVDVGGRSFSILTVKFVREPTFRVSVL